MLPARVSDIAAEVWGVSEGSLGVGEPELRLLEAS